MKDSTRFILLFCLASIILGVAYWNPITSTPPCKPKAPRDDAALVRSLLGDDLSNRTFSFATIAEACSGKKVLPLSSNPAHLRVTAAITQALTLTLAEINQPDSPVRQLRRINEASRFFEDGIHKHINEMPGLKCDVPPTRSGEHQRSGYPDLRIIDEESNLVFYLDPKLVEQGSAESTFRTFYFEPKNETLKITEDAVHLLVGIEHDGKERAWTFTGWRLVDLSTLQVRLKAEFQASNADLYEKTELSLPQNAR
ncbi:MAG: hypothetical protein ABIS50_18125 [Luteolibacter sp.]|uniref:hypothetical protein n=1 Tax=Luteolibacter sp. TaxID=1962973 RepID=UPI003262D0B6